MFDRVCVAKIDPFSHRLGYWQTSKAQAPSPSKKLDARLCGFMSDSIEHFKSVTAETAFRWPRNFLANRFVYTVISPPARGLSIGVNMNPNRDCNFDCVYCEVDRERPIAHSECGHLRLKTLSQIRQRIKGEAGLRAEVF
jgi:sulfatase maturation enzyme AslB (radical SAM superfamily)